MKKFGTALCALALSTGTLLAQGKPQQLAYVGTLDHKLLVIDEDTESVVSTIDLGGLPRTIIPSADEKQLYILNTRMGLEIVDLPTRKVTGVIDLLTANKVRVAATSRNWLNGSGASSRFSGIVPDPTGKYLYATLRTVDKGLNEYTLNAPEFVTIDIASKSIIKRSPFPKEWDTGFGFQASFKVSPDGKSLWVFDEDISIVDLATMKVTDTIPLSKPPYPGASPYRIAPVDLPYDGKSKVTSVFTAVDPIVHKGTIGTASIDMNTRKVDYTPIGVALPMVGFVVAPGGKTGYSVMYAGAGGNRTTEWWTWDIPNHKVVQKMPFDARTTFSFGMSGDGSKLYLYGAGPTLEIYNARTLKSEKLLNFQRDLTTRVVTMRPVSDTSSAQGQP